MKIGILTFHRAINYGAFLQCLATKTFLEKKGIDTDVIDYWPIEHQLEYKKSSFLNTLKYSTSIVGFVRLFINLILNFGRTNIRMSKMEHLAIKYLSIDQMVKYEKREDLRDLSYDIIVYGSDQIWWKYKKMYPDGFDPAYWGEYVPYTVKKIAYAPSMGIIDLNDDDKQKIARYLINFNAISVRENELLETLTPLTAKKICQVIDPVFLLSPDEWDVYCKPVKEKKYILLYSLIPSEEASHFAKQLGKLNGLKVIEITGYVHPLKIGSRYKQTLDAIEFISYIKGADYVVTTSFHGTAFSIIFEKQFYSMGLGKKAGRVKSLLELLNLENRLIEGPYISSAIDVNIEYSKVWPLLKKEIEISKKYLKDNIV